MLKTNLETSCFSFLDSESRTLNGFKEKKAGKMTGHKASSTHSNSVMDSSPCMVSDQNMVTSVNHLLTKLMKQNSAHLRLMDSNVTIKARDASLGSQETSIQDHNCTLDKNFRS